MFLYKAMRRPWMPSQSKRYAGPVDLLPEGPASPMQAEAVLLSGADITHHKLGLARIKGVIDLSRIRNGECPLLDNHSLRNHPIGRVSHAWLDRNIVRAKLVFDHTRAGHKAFDL